MVGQPTSNPVSLDPQHPLPAVQNAFGNSSGIGQAQGPPQSTAGQGIMGNDGGLGQASGQAGGQLSGQVSGQASGQVGGQVSGQVSGQASGPLGYNGGLGQASGPPGALGTDGGFGQTVAGTGHGVIGNMPSIAQTGDPSLVPLIIGTGTAASASGLLAAAAISSRPSSSRPSTGSSSQALGPLVTPANPQGSYQPTPQSWNTSHGYGQASAGPSTVPKNNGTTTKLSISSVASASSAYSSASWMGNSSSSRNAGDNNRGGGASSSQEAPLYDEQGRPLNMPPEKVPLVHLDGALYQDDDSRSGYEPPAYIE